MLPREELTRQECVAGLKNDKREDSTVRKECAEIRTCYQMRKGGNNIPFPFPPYAQQHDLMGALLECFDSSSVGVFESPTGTGKSLSIICSAMYWLRNKVSSILDEVKDLQTRNEHTSSSKTPGDSTQSEDWLNQWIKESNENNIVENEMELKFEALVKYNAMLSRISEQNRVERSQHRLVRKEGLKTNRNEFATSKKILRVDKPFRENPHFNNGSAHTGEEYVLDDSFLDENYDSGGNQSDTLRDEDTVQDESDRGGLKELKLPQIYYCSRTHSQLTQFVREIRRTKYTDARCITLGSRKNLCVNNEINHFGAENIITKKCLELQVSYNAN